MRDLYLTRTVSSKKNFDVHFVYFILTIIHDSKSRQPVLIRILNPFQPRLVYEGPRW